MEMKEWRNVDSLFSFSKCENLINKYHFESIRTMNIINNIDYVIYIFYNNLGN